MIKHFQFFFIRCHYISKFNIQISLFNIKFSFLRIFLFLFPIDTSLPPDFAHFFNVISKLSHFPLIFFLNSFLNLFYNMFLYVFLSLLFTLFEFMTYDGFVWTFFFEINSVLPYLKLGWVVSCHNGKQLLLFWHFLFELSTIDWNMWKLSY